MKIVCFIVLFFLSLVAVGQQSVDSCQHLATSQSHQSQSHSYIKSYLYSGLTILEQPLHYDWKDWTVFAGVATASTIAFIYDDEIFGFVDNIIDDNTAANVSIMTDLIAEEYVMIPGIATAYIVGTINKDDRLRNVSLSVLQSFIFAELTTAGIKVLTCRERPGGNISYKSSADIHSYNQSQNWAGPFASFENTSFVSGHAMRSFAVATTVAGLYPEKPWLGVISYSLATMTSLGRIIAKEHWTSDVIVGAAIGYFIGKGVVKFNQKLDKSSKIDVEVVATQYGMGFALKF